MRKYLNNQFYRDEFGKCRVLNYCQQAKENFRDTGWLKKDNIQKLIEEEVYIKGTMTYICCVLDSDIYDGLLYLKMFLS